MLQIKHYEQKKNIPQSFDEMDKRMLHAWFDGVYSQFSFIFDSDGKVNKGKEKQAEELYHICMVIVCDFDIQFVDSLALVDPVDGLPIYDDNGELVVYCMLDYLLYEKKVLGFMFGEFSLTTDPLPEKDGLINYGENFQNLRIDEYYFADAKFTDYLKTKNSTELDLMLACFYRPKQENFSATSPNTDGDPREIFNELIVEQRLPIIEKWSEQEKITSLLYYISCRNNLQKQFPYLFQKSASSGAPLSLAESLITLCGGPFEYDKNRGIKVIQLFAGLSANAKQAPNE